MEVWEFGREGLKVVPSRKVPGVTMCICSYQLGTLHLRCRSSSCCYATVKAASRPQENQIETVDCMPPGAACWGTCLPSPLRLILLRFRAIHTCVAE